MKVENFPKGLKKFLSPKGVGVGLIALVAGLILLLFPEKEETALVVPDDGILTSAEYCDLLEQKAEDMIKSLPQVKNCQVFITLEKGYRYVYATDQKVREESGSKETEKNIVLAEGKEGDNPILIEESMPKVAGVAVVCGGASYETKYHIVELMCALFDIPSNRINVQT